MKTTPPPSAAEGFNLTERTGTFTGNPVGVQYLNRFLRDVGSFSLGVPGQGNPLGNNIGADEKAAPTVAGGVLQAAQDALGIDYNNDGRGFGFNVPSLLGLHGVPPYLHNGAAESLAAVVSDLKHRTANGQLPDGLADPADQAKVVAFLESIDLDTVPFVPLAIRRLGNQVFVGFDSIAGASYALEGKDTLTGSWTGLAASGVGTGAWMELAVTLDRPTRFLRLVPGP